MSHNEIRTLFIDFFKQVHHTYVPAASLVSDVDPTVLFTVAGMQQFKPYYEHPDQTPSPRIVTIQPCIRTVDIDEVGDSTHNTVFEMLGNFSFGYTGNDSDTGPYFKKTALSLAWDFLTNKLSIPANRIRATYFGGDEKRLEDTESRDLLKELPGLSRVEAYGQDNFWGPVGDSGPCGPNVEFYVDDIEVWNNVFNEYIRDTKGNYTKLEHQGVDTGMGLERLLGVLQQKDSVYETDLFTHAMQTIKEKAYNFQDKHARIIADHVKAALFLLSDGVKPGNKGRDYILRRLVRRAVRAGQLIGFSEYDQLLRQYSEQFSPYYHSIRDHTAEFISLFVAEKEKFLKTLQSGINQLEKIIASGTNGEVTAEQAFKLFDTFGFPLELTQEIAQERGWTVDSSGFEAQFATHREKSKVGSEGLFQGGLADHDAPTVAHHTAHHLLLAALRQILGDHVVQRGSNITRERLRIDITHPEKITEEQLKLVEDLVNQKIAEDLPVISEMMDRDQAIASGALAEFGTKYPNEACVYSIIDQDGSVYSRELCGGPHVMSTGELGKFKILKEEGSSAGVRRIRARVVPK